MFYMTFLVIQIIDSAIFYTDDNQPLYEGLLFLMFLMIFFSNQHVLIYSNWQRVWPCLYDKLFPPSSPSNKIWSLDYFMPDSI